MQTPTQLELDLVTSLSIQVEQDLSVVCGASRCTEQSYKRQVLSLFINLEGRKIYVNVHCTIVHR